MSDQVWKVPVSPAQRLMLLHISHADGTMVQGQEGRRFRRFLRAFGIGPISEEMRSTGRISKDMAQNETPALFEITAENREYALKLVEAKKTPLQEVIVGPLLDLLEELKPEYEPPAGIPDYDPAAESWAENKVRDDLLDELLEQIEPLSDDKLKALVGKIREIAATLEPHKQASPQA